MTDVDPSTWELHNIVKTPSGLRTRSPLWSIKTPTSGSFVGGFTVEVPSSTEVHHYLFEQGTDGTTTLRVVTEEFFELYNFPLGVLQQNPVITWAIGNNQILINSPAFSAPLYGVVGGGVVTAVATMSLNTDTTSLDLPQGHICSFGDRSPIAQNQVVFFNDPPSAKSVDPRSYVAQNVLGLPGSVFDLFQGPDGALWMFTSAGVYTMPPDALGQGQTVVGSIARVPGIDTSRPRNACATIGTVAVLQRDHVVLLPSGTIVDLSPYNGPRRLSNRVEVEDLRLSAEIFPTPRGFIVAFRGNKPFFLVADLKNQSFSYVIDASTSYNAVGVLRTRDGEPLYVLSDRVVMQMGISDRDSWAGIAQLAVACGMIETSAADRPVLRSLTTNTEFVGQPVGVSAGRDGLTSLTQPTITGDTIIGTSQWSSTGSFIGRTFRSTRHNVSQRMPEPPVEVQIGGLGRRVGLVDVDLAGQGRSRRDQN